MRPSNQPAAKSSSSQPTAMDILGLNRVTSSKPEVTLKKEVGQYLSNPNTGSGILAFWQVICVPSAIGCFTKIYSGT
jgi:hypothetical protein